MRVARQRPDLFYAYVGTDQNVGMQRTGKENHEALSERLRSLGFAKGAEAVEHLGPDPAHWSADDFETVARWTMRSDPTGFRQTMKLLKQAVWYSPQWTLRDIRALMAGMRHSLQQLLPEISRYDSWKDGLHFEIPFFIFQGETDVLTAPKDAQAFFDDVAAPVKCFSLIAEAGHFAAFLQPEQFLQRLLLYVRPLSEHASSGGICEDDSQHCFRLAGDRDRLECTPNAEATRQGDLYP
jgi:pimeloyl-ACP methyl ester carboxylesterase